MIHNKTILSCHQFMLLLLLYVLDVVYEQKKEREEEEEERLQTIDGQDTHAINEQAKEQEREINPFGNDNYVTIVKLKAIPFIEF